MRRTAGVLGGMGPDATVDFMQRVNRLSRGASEQDGARMLVDSDPGVPDRNAALAGTGPSPGPALARMAKGLEAAGADFLVMACNTAHVFEAEIVAATTLPFFSIVEETIAPVLSALGGGRTVGLLATKGLLQSGLYQDAFARRGLVCVQLSSESVTEFMALLYLIKAGDTGPQTAARMRALAGELQKSGAEAIVSACTEVPLVLTQAMIDVPLVDSTECLAQATVELASGRRPLTA